LSWKVWTLRGFSTSCFLRTGLAPNTIDDPDGLLYMHAHMRCLLRGRHPIDETDAHDQLRLNWHSTMIMVLYLLTTKIRSLIFIRLEAGYGPFRLAAMDHPVCDCRLYMTCGPLSNHTSQFRTRISINHPRKRSRRLSWRACVGVQDVFQHALKLKLSASWKAEVLPPIKYVG
jgi:hypothetical protein